MSKDNGTSVLPTSHLEVPMPAGASRPRTAGITVGSVGDLTNPEPPRFTHSNVITDPTHKHPCDPGHIFNVPPTWGYPHTTHLTHEQRILGTLEQILVAVGAALLAAKETNVLLGLLVAKGPEETLVTKGKKK